MDNDGSAQNQDPESIVPILQPVLALAAVVAAVSIPFLDSESASNSAKRLRLRVNYVDRIHCECRLFGMYEGEPVLKPIYSVADATIKGVPLIWVTANNSWVSFSNVSRNLNSAGKCDSQCKPIKKKHCKLGFRAKVTLNDKVANAGPFDMAANHSIFDSKARAKGTSYREHRLAVGFGKYIYAKGLCPCGPQQGTPPFSKCKVSIQVGGGHAYLNYYFSCFKCEATGG